MSPDKPKSRLRQLAESSTKKYSRTSLPAQANLPSNPDLQPIQNFVLNLGTPPKPPIDSKLLKNYRPPPQRSLGPRRSSIITSKRTIIHSKSPPKPSIENLLDDLEILDRSQPKLQSRSHPTKNSILPTSNSITISNKPRPPPQNPNQHPPILIRKSRRITISHLSADETDRASTDRSKASSTDHDQLEPTKLETCQTVDDDHSDPSGSQVDHGSSSSDDSFDPQSLLPSHQKQNQEGHPEELDQAELSVIVNAPRSSTRTRSALKSKRVIPDSDGDSEPGSDDPQSPAPPSSSTRLKQSTSQSAPTRRRSQRKTSLKANHSQLKSIHSNQPRIPPVDHTDSDDSIEILPSRAALFQETRSKILSTLNNPPSTPCRSTGLLSTPKDIMLSSENDLVEDFLGQVLSDEEGCAIRVTKDSTSVVIPPTSDVESVQVTKPKASNRTPTDPIIKTKPSKKTRAPKPVPFAKQRDALAMELIDELDDKVFQGRLPSELGLVWSKRLNTTAGRAKWSIFKDRDGHQTREAIQIELATKVIDCEQKLRNTLAHELCHVACWIIDRQKDEKHGRFFKSWARKIHKAMPDIRVTTKHDYVISYKFNWRCSQPDCTKVYGRHSNSISPDRHRCVCGGALIALPRRGKKAVEAPPTPARPERQEARADDDDDDDHETGIDDDDPSRAAGRVEMDLSDRLKDLKVSRAQESSQV